MPLRSSVPIQGDVAREAGVTGATVSRALSGNTHVDPTTRRRIEQIAERLGYRPNPVVGHLMARLRMGQKESHKATLAIMSPHPPERLQEIPPLRKFIEGATARARELGYSVEIFWMLEPGIRIDRWKRILDARNIRGVLVTGLFHFEELFRSFEPVWESRACVTIGARNVDSCLHFAANDLFASSTLAVKELGKLGYRKPAQVIEEGLDIHLEGRVTGGFLSGYHGLETSPDMILHMDYPPDLTRLLRWVRHQRPDAIICGEERMLDWLRQGGIRVPEEMGVIRLDLHVDEPGWAGINQNSDLVAKAAVDLLVGQLHRGEFGEPSFQKCILIEGRWIPGSTVRQQQETTRAQPGWATAHR